MISRASRRSALFLATGMLVVLAGPSQAASGAANTAAAATSEDAAAAPITLYRTYRHASHHQHYAHHRSHRIASKNSDDKDAKKATDVATADDKTLPAIPPSIANANAQFPSVASQSGTATAIAAQTDVADAAPDHSTDVKTDNGNLVVAADELNDVDRSLHESTPPVPPADIAPNPPPAPVAKASRESSVWDETSLIGKIFIGFGALLTMASAARMFMA